MTLKPPSVCAVLLVAFVTVLGCAGSSGEDSNPDAEPDADASLDAAQDATPGDDAAPHPELVYWADISAIFEARSCDGCHIGTPDTYDSVVQHWIEGEDGNLLGPMMEIGHKVHPDQADTVLHWLDTGYPEE